ncbi:MAG: ParB N-terminal domain-containing protein [Myxococcota bacterium]
MATKRKKKTAGASVGLGARELAQGQPTKDVQALAEQVQADGGVVLTSYREPYGGHWVMLVLLPIDMVQPTPYQRELSKTHADRLTSVIPKVGRFLDPVVAIRHDDIYWTPNGMHRLAALNALGAKAVVALLMPEKELAYRILALNTEKAHNLKDKALEVVRMARGLAASPESAKRPESDWAFEFEEPAYLTLGLCYELQKRFAGAVYLPVVKRCEEFSSQPLIKSVVARAERAKLLLELDDVVNDVVKQLKDKGFKSAYLKPYVVARINPLRFVRAAKPGQKAPRADFDATLEKMLSSAKKFDVGKVKQQDIAMVGAYAPAEE